MVFMKQKISINAENAVARPNPKMWGIFIEEINHAGDGGLYAEQIRNRAFADSNLPEGTIYSGGKAQTKLQFTMRHYGIFLFFCCFSILLKNLYATAPAIHAP
jgi:hypothetical protein